MRAIAVIVFGIHDRANHNHESMQTTLRRMKAHLEGASTPSDRGTSNL